MTVRDMSERTKRPGTAYLVVGLAIGLASIWSCSSDGKKSNPFQTGAGGDDDTSGGRGGSPAPSGGKGGDANKPSGGSAGSAGGTGGTVTGGSGGSTGGSGGGSGGSTAGSGGGSGGDKADSGADAGEPMGGMSGSNAITAVVKTAGCGKPPGMAGARTIATKGTKPEGCADSKCGAWMYERQYNVILPKPYDNNKPYPLVFQGPGCGGEANNIYPLDEGMGANIGNTVIRVGVTPPPNAIGHATNPNQGCFDDKEGDDSVEFPAYEAIYDKLAEEFCFDRNRVFAGGNSSGAWWANELGCKYAGDANHAIRGIFPNTGGLPTDPKYRPTCSTKPMAGMWSHEIGDTTNPFTGNKEAISRAMKVNGCTMGSSYDDAVAMSALEDFPIGGTNPASTCKKIKGCPALYPLVVCALQGTAHGSHDNVVNYGAPKFIKMFSMGDFITP